MDPSASGRLRQATRRRHRVDPDASVARHIVRLRSEGRETVGRGAGRPLVCVGRRALSKQRTRNPCRAMRCRWLGLSVGHCGIKLLRRSRDNVSTQSVCMSVRGPSLPPSGIIVSCSTRDSQLRRGAQIISLSLSSVLLHSDSRGRAGRRQGCDNSEYGNKRRHMLDTCSSAAEAVATVTFPVRTM